MGHICCSIHFDKDSHIDCGLRPGMAWLLQRVQAAPWLHISLFFLGARWQSYAPEIPVELVNSLQKHVEAVAAASKNLHHLRLLVTGHPNHSDDRKALMLSGA